MRTNPNSNKRLSAEQKEERMRIFRDLADGLKGRRTTIRLPDASQLALSAGGHGSGGGDGGSSGRGGGGGNHRKSPYNGRPWVRLICDPGGAVFLDAAQETGDHPHEDARQGMEAALNAFGWKDLAAALPPELTVTGIDVQDGCVEISIKTLDCPPVPDLHIRLPFDHERIPLDALIEAMEMCFLFMSMLGKMSIENTCLAGQFAADLVRTHPNRRLIDTATRAVNWPVLSALMTHLASRENQSVAAHEICVTGPSLGIGFTDHPVGLPDGVKANKVTVIDPSPTRVTLLSQRMPTMKFACMDVEDILRKPNHSARLQRSMDWCIALDITEDGTLNLANRLANLASTLRPGGFLVLGVRRHDVLTCLDGNFEVPRRERATVDILQIESILGASEEVRVIELDPFFSALTETYIVAQKIGQPDTGLAPPKKHGSHSS